MLHVQLRSVAFALKRIKNPSFTHFQIYNINRIKKRSAFIFLLFKSNMFKYFFWSEIICLLTTAR